MQESLILGAVAVGIGATLVMDLWNRSLKAAFGIPSLNLCLLGRWLRHMQSGSFAHASIAAAEPKTGECAVGAIAHYTIGVVFALVLVLLTSGAWLLQPTVLPALAVGVVTVVFPFLVMQPAFGLGVASARTPNPTIARVKSLMSHTVFGLGLYFCALGVSYVLHQ